MRDYIELGSTPYDEECIQVGEADYRQKARIECRAYIDMLKRKHGKPPNGATYSIKAFHHDFGAYYEVVLSFDDEDESACEYAYSIEGQLPASWDAKAVVFIWTEFSKLI